MRRYVLQRLTQFAIVFFLVTFGVMVFLRLGLDAYTTYDFDGFQQTVNSVYYAHVHGHTWGYHLVSALLFWVPRSIWKGKAFAAGNAVAASRGGKVKTVVQAVAIGLYLLPINAFWGSVRWWLMGVALIVTLATGLDYVARAVRLRRRTSTR